MFARVLFVDNTESAFHIYCCSSSLRINHSKGSLSWGRWGSVIESAFLVQSLWTIQSGINDMPLSSEQDQADIG